MQYLGRASITYDGQEIDSMPGAKINLGGIKRKQVVGMHRVGYSEEVAAATVECDLMVSATTPIEEIRSIAGATVVFRTDIGKAWMIRDAFIEDPLDVTSGDGGKVKIKLTGAPAETV
jgi:hypothetical protein